MSILARDTHPVEESHLLISDASFAALSQRVEERTGIVLAGDKHSLVMSRLSRRLKHLGYSSFDAYCQHLDGPNGAAEFREVVLLLTTNVTRFFREPHHFERLRQILESGLADHARRGGRVRMWSAGCSSGEEPFSMAMIVHDVIPEASKYDIRILATDLDSNMLTRARRGLYGDATVRMSGHPLLDRYLEPKADDSTVLEVTPDVRAIVKFADLNLQEAWPMQGQFDVIFCRNVVIYFAAATQQALWPRFAEALRPGGHLMIGHSERVTGPATTKLTSDGVTQYKRTA